jgi:hypothetical protein
MELNELIRQHGKSVAFVFKRMDIDAPVTPKDVALVAAMYGEAFVDALEEQITLDEGYSGWPGVGVGEPEYKQLPEIVISPKAKKATNGLRNILTTIADTLGTFAASKRNATIHKDDGFVDDVQVQKKKTNYFLIAALVLIAVLAVVLAVSKKHK